MADCFTLLISHGKRFDEGIKKLTETWRYPQNILGGYGADMKQAEADLQILIPEINALKTNIAADATSRENHMAEIENFLEESEQMLEDLLESCNDIRTVLSEYGYVGPDAESSVNKMEIECSVNSNSSLISSDVTDDLLEVEFTPNLTWRHKAKVNVS